MSGKRPKIRAKTKRRKPFRKAPAVVVSTRVDEGKIRGRTEARIAVSLIMIIIGAFLPWKAALCVGSLLIFTIFQLCRYWDASRQDGAILSALTAIRATVCLIAGSYFADIIQPWFL